MKKPISLAWTRDFTLTWAEWWSRDMNPRLEGVFGRGVPHQLSYYNGRMLETYRPVRESAEFINAVVQTSLRSAVLGENAIRRYIELNKKIRSILRGRRSASADRTTFSKVMTFAAEMYPWYTACYLLPQEPWVNQLIQKHPTGSRAILGRLLRARKQSEGTIELLIEYWRAISRTLLTARSMPSIYFSFVTFSELEKMLNDPRYRPSLRALEERSKGYVFFRNSVYTGISKHVFFRKHNYLLTGEPMRTGRNIHGTVAHPGPRSIVGTVSVILRNSEVKQFRAGHILVTVMTNPFFLPIIKKAKAVVTDEGGITCHAAITARELKKPCVIGTKIATKVLKDGDRVEVDATKGIVRKL